MPRSAARRPIYGAIMLESLLDSVATGILLPAIPLLAVQLGATAFMVAALVSCQFVGGVVGSLVLGWLGDRVPRGLLLLATLLALAVSYGCLPFVSTLHWLFALRIVAGFMGSNLVLLESFVSDMTSHDNRPAGFANLRLGSTVGLITGPGIAAVLIGGQWIEGVQGMLVLAAVVAAVQPLVMAFALRGQLTSRVARPPASSGPEGGVLARFVGTARIREFALVKMLVAICFASLMVIAPVWGVNRLGWGAQEFSYLVVAFGMSLLVVQIAIAREAWPWLTTPAALFLACAMVVAGFLLLIAAPSSASMFACCILLGLGSAVVNIVVPVSISRDAPLNVAAMLGLLSTTVLVGSTAVPMALGAVYETAGGAWAWAGAGSCALMAALLAWRHLPGRAAPCKARADV